MSALRSRDRVRSRCSRPVREPVADCRTAGGVLKDSSTVLNPADLGGTVHLSTDTDTYDATEFSEPSSSVIGPATEQCSFIRGEKLLP